MGGCFKSNTIENCKKRLIDLYMNLLSTMSDILNHNNVSVRLQLSISRFLIITKPN